MKRFIFASLALAFLAFGAHAQSTKDTAPANIWAGPYIGVNLGGLFDYHEIGTGASTISGVGAGGWTGGVTAGYDLALNNYLVGLWVEGTAEQSSGKISGVSINAQNSWAIGGRAGYIIAPNALVYGKVGFIQEFYDTNLPGSNINPLSGVTYGGGVEYAITNAIFGHFEYRHDDYENAALGHVSEGLAIEDSVTANRVIVGITYKFSGAAVPLDILPAQSNYKPLK